MRPIDADVLVEQFNNLEAQALEHYTSLKHPSNEMGKEDYAEWQVWSAIYQERGAFKYDVLDAPTVDAVPVVRCKDCKCWDKEDRYCIDFMTNEEDGFCKWGERGEDGEEA